MHRTALVTLSAVIAMLIVAPAFGREPASNTCPPFIYAHHIKATNISCRALTQSFG